MGTFNKKNKYESGNEFLISEKNRKIILT